MNRRIYKNWDRILAVILTVCFILSFCSSRIYAKENTIPPTSYRTIADTTEEEKDIIDESVLIEPRNVFLQAAVSPTDPRYKVTNAIDTEVPARYEIRATGITKQGIGWTTAFRVPKASSQGEDLRIAILRDSKLGNIINFGGSAIINPLREYSIIPRVTGQTNYYLWMNDYYGPMGANSVVYPTFTTPIANMVPGVYTITVDGYYNWILTPDAPTWGTKYFENINASVEIYPITTTVNPVYTNSSVITGTVSKDRLSPVASENIATININGTDYTTTIAANGTYSYPIPAGVTLTQGQTIKVTGSNGLVTHVATTSVNSALKTSFTIIKHGELDTGISGAEFTLYGATTGTPMTPDLSKIVQNATPVNADGVLTFSDLPKGTYFLKETKAPNGYMLLTTYYRVVIDQSGEVLTVSIFDGPNSTIPLPKTIQGYSIIKNIPVRSHFNLKKVDQKGRALPNAQFTLKQGLTTIQQSSTDSSGNVQFVNLAPGDYVLTETLTPIGYYPNEDVYYAHVDGVGNITIRLNHPTTGTILQHEPQLTVMNYKKGSLEVKKVDEEGMALPAEGEDGAQFRLLGKLPLTVDIVLTVDEQGIAKFENLEPGAYTLQESRAPIGYKMDESIYQVTVGRDGVVTIIWGEEDLSGQPLIVRNSRLRSDIVFTKIDSVEKGALSGTTFQLYQPNPVQGEEPIAIGVPIISGENGIVQFTELLPGEYLIKEITAPEGFALDSRSYELSLAMDGTVTIHTENGNLMYSQIEPEKLVFYNYKIGEYPATGGIGSLPFILLGFAFMIVAIIMKKRVEG